MAKMKSEQHVWEEIYDAITEVESTIESDVINAIRDMEKVDEVIKSSGYAHWYHKRGGGTSGEFQKVIKMVNETSNVIHSGMIHQKTLASIDSKFAEKMKQAIENHLNKVNEGDHKYKSTIMHTVDTTIGQYDEYGNYSEYTVQQTIPLSADELMQLNQPELQGLKEKYQKELETYKSKMISDPQTKLSDEQKKQIENMNVTQFLGYTGSIGEYKGALSDSQEAWKTFGLITDIVVGIGSVVAAPFTGGLSLAAGAAYFTGKAAHGLITGKNLYTGETLTNEDKEWLVFDAATSLLAAGAGIKALSSGGKVLNAVVKAATIGDHTLNLVQAGMAGGSGIQMLQKGDIIGGVTLLSLAALGAHGGAKTSKVAGEVEENVAKTATKTSIASERMGQFVDKMSDLKVKGLNAFDNASVKFADAMGLGDNLAFAGGTMGVGKSFNHVDDAVGKTIAKVEGTVDGVLDEMLFSREIETISDELWDTHINSIHKLSQGEIKGGHNFDSIITDLQRKYGLSDDDVSKMLVKSKEIIPPGGIHEIKYKGPQLSPGQTWDDNPLPLKRDGSQELMLKNKNKTKTVFDPTVYDPNAIRAGMDDALRKHLVPNPDKKNYFEGVGKVVNKEGETVEMRFEFVRNRETGRLSTAYPIG